MEDLQQLERNILILLLNSFPDKEPYMLVQQIGSFLRAVQTGAKINLRSRKESARRQSNKSLVKRNK